MGKLLSPMVAWMASPAVIGPICLASGEPGTAQDARVGAAVSIYITGRRREVRLLEPSNGEILSAIFGARSSARVFALCKAGSIS
jgi:hypothetical protein